MELLNYSDSEHEDESPSEEKGHEEPIRSVALVDADDLDSKIHIPQTKWAVLESSDEEDNLDQAGEHDNGNEPTTISADILLASIAERPSFLSKPPSQKKFEIKPVVNHAYTPKNAPPVTVEPKPEPEKKEKTKAITRERFLAEQAKTQQQQLSGNPALDSILAASKLEKDKETVKDRVKRQRLSGQSGIGEDFKVWKSEEEMRHRQQFD